MRVVMCAGLVKLQLRSQTPWVLPGQHDGTSNEQILLPGLEMEAELIKILCSDMIGLRQSAGKDAI